MLRLASNVDDQIDDKWATLLVGLNDEADTVPPCERWLIAKMFEQSERNLQPVSFLGIDVQGNVVVLGQHDEREETRVELIFDTFDFGSVIARMQSRQFDRDAWAS